MQILPISITSFFLKIVLLLACILLAFRLALPHFLIWYAENRINQIPEYKVKIKDLDVHLYKGSYTIKGISLYKITKNIPVPFFKAESIELAVQWRSLLHGAFLAKMKLNKPAVNFVIDPTGKNEQLTIDKEWQRAVKALFPLNFNEIIINDGKLSLRSLKGNPPFNLYLKAIDLQVENIQKVNQKKIELNSFFKAHAKTMDGAEVKLDGTFDSEKASPTFSINGSLVAMNIASANNFLKHFTHVDVKQGSFSLFLEAAAAQGKIHGYAKPFIKNLQILDPKEKVGPIEFLYKGALELVSKIVTNHKKETIATKINISGDIATPDTSLFSIISYLLRHAFIQALVPQVDHTIETRDIIINNKSLQT